VVRFGVGVKVEIWFSDKVEVRVGVKIMVKVGCGYG